MRVRQIMTQNIACCTPDTSLEEIARLMAERDCGAIPIVEDKEHKHLIGIVTDRDITCRVVAEGANPLDLTAADCMTSSVITSSPEEDLEECCRKMEEHQLRRIPVTDAKGCCCGMVAQADIARQTGEHETAEVLKDISRPAHRAAASRSSATRARRAKRSA